MRCPKCGEDSKVVDSRTNDQGTTIRRRRECLGCSFRFTTYEKIEDMPLIVVKKSGRRELFDPSKILKGLVKACEKRPITIDYLEKVADDIEKELKSKYTEVSSKLIGETTMAHLKEIDQVAFVRFASVYKEFADVKTFIQEIEQLKEGHVNE